LPSIWTVQQPNFVPVISEHVAEVGEMVGRHLRTNGPDHPEKYCPVSKVLNAVVTSDAKLIGGAHEKRRKRMGNSPHQPGEAVFRSILPEEIDWKPVPSVPTVGPIGRACGGSRLKPDLTHSSTRPCKRRA
jgi:hypothetical protein